MRTPTYEQEDEFLRESNAIEGVHDQGSLLDAHAAWDYLHTRKKLTIPAVLKVHELLMVNQPIPSHSLGWWRSCRIFIGRSEGLNWQYIPSAMEEWVNKMNMDLDFASTAEDREKTSRSLHVEYEKIHPFIDGNGRTGRMFMNWHRLQHKMPLLIIHEGEEQMEYYKWFNED